VVENGSEIEESLLEQTKEISGTFPMLQLQDDQLMCDSLAIVALLSRVHGNETYIGNS